MEEHLGICLATNETEELNYIQKRIRSCRPVVHAMRSIGSHKVPLSPCIANKLYMSVVTPKMTYGMEAMNSNDEVIEALEAFHSDNAKLLQGLPKQSANPSGLFTMGWKSIQSLIDVIRLQFLWRVIILPMDNIYKRVMLTRLYQVSTQEHNTIRDSPIVSIVKICSKYGLLNRIFDAIEAGQYMPKCSWNKLVKHIVYDHDFKRQVTTCILYRSLDRVKFGSRFEISSWWKLCKTYPKFSKIGQCIVRLLVAAGQFEKQRCNKCNECMQMTFEHILFTCPEYDTKRKDLWRKVIQACPDRLAKEFNAMPNKDKTNILMNGLNNSYVYEWKDLFKCIGDFLNQMCIEYKK